MEKKLPRGLRNNNPLNIEYNVNNGWYGQVGSDGRFCVFKERKWGYRAAYKLLAKYLRRGLKTPAEIISRWAPDSENNTSAYIDWVCKKIGMDKDFPIYADGELLELLYGMACYENGMEVDPLPIFKMVNDMHTI